MSELPKIWANPSKDERSLILFFETAHVDHGGLLSSAHLNGEDFDLANLWHEVGFIRFERVHSSQYLSNEFAKNHVVHLSPDAFKCAHYERMERAKRCYASRRRKTISEIDAVADALLEGVQ